MDDVRPEEIDAAIELFLTVARRLGYSVERGHKVLDFGCGIGKTVDALLRRNIDAVGVDINAFWGADFAGYWRDAPRPSAAVAERLFVLDPRAYELPFADSHFDFCISAQVFEHVTNHGDVFRELRRVLKPGAVSLHVFPGPLTPYEPHIFVPIIPLCRYDWWLTLWALTRRRQSAGTTALDEGRSQRAFLDKCSYPSRRTLRRMAEAASLQIEFRQRDYLECSIARTSRLYRQASRIGMGFAAEPLLGAICQRMMVLRRPT